MQIVFRYEHSCHSSRSSYHFFHEGQIEAQSSSEVGPFIELTNFTPNMGILDRDKEISPTDISVLLVGPIFIFSNGCVENKLSINSVGALPLRNIHLGLVLVSKSDTNARYEINAGCVS